MAARRRDPKTGLFLTTTDTTRYKTVQFNNQRMSEHARTMCIALNIPRIPKGMLVHHIDKNTHNNNIDNLALMNHYAHNKIHSHEAWNKGIKANENKKWGETIIKAQKSRNEHYLPIFKNYYDLRNSGISIINIGKQFNKSRATIYSGIKKYEQLINRRKD